MIFTPLLWWCGEWQEKCLTGKGEMHGCSGSVGKGIAASPAGVCSLFWLHTDAVMVCAHTSHELTCLQVHVHTYMHTDNQTKAWILLGRRESAGSDSQFCSLGSLVKLLVGSPIFICIQPFRPRPQEASRWTDQLPLCILAQAKGLCRVILCPTTISLFLSFPASRVHEPLCFNHGVFLPQSLEAQLSQESTSLN